MRKRVEVKAVWDSDLENLLKNLGILEPLLLGELKCAICNRIVDLDNLAAIIPQKDSVIAICDNATCISKLSKQKVISSSD